MKPDEFFEAFVLGNQEDYAADPSCLRRAFNAAVSASHMADHYFAYNARHDPALVAPWANTGSFVRHVIKQTQGAFGDIRSISNAYKHLYEERKGGGPAQWTVASGGALQSVQFAGASRPLQSVETDYGSDDALAVCVVFRRRDGTRAEFASTLESVVRYWQATLWPPGAQQAP